VIELWQAVILALITVGGSVLAAILAGKSSVKVKELDVDGQAYLRAEGITANLIKKLEDSIVRIEKARDDDNAEHQKELAKRDQRLDEFEKKLRALGDHNQALTTFVYVVLAILRRHNLIGEINPKDVPDGIRI
jgi:hypothetical protein